MDFASRPILTREDARLAALRDYDILDTPSEPEFDALVQAVATICDTPIAALSLVDEKRQWFKASVGLNGAEDPREHSFCSHAILADEIMEIVDAHEDARFVANPLVTGEPHIRFYAGQKLVTPTGYAVGALCAIDRVPRRLTPAQRQALRGLGRVAERLLEARRVDRMTDRLEEAVANAEAAFATAPIAMGIADLDAQLVRTNPEMQRLLDRGAAELSTLSLIDIAHPDEAHAVTDNLRRLRYGDEDSVSVERRWIDASGHVLWVLLSATLIRHRDGTPSHIVVQAQDFSARRKMESALADAARHDELTGLNNRRAFNAALTREWLLSTRDGVPSYVVVLDMDGLKHVNDTQGHAAGDEALRALGEALAVTGRETDVLARVGGDEFAAILVRAKEANAPEAFEARVRAALRERTSGFDPPIGVSMGWSSLIATESPDAAYSKADAAMYRMKRAAKTQEGADA